MKKISTIVCFLSILVFNILLINFHKKHLIKKASWKSILPKIRHIYLIKNHSIKKIKYKNVTLNKFKQNKLKRLSTLNIKFLPFKHKYNASNTIPTSNLLLTQKKQKLLNAISSNIDKFFEFYGSRTTIIRYSKNSSLNETSKAFNREDYLNLHINGKDRLQNIRADIIENNLFDNIGNKIKIDAEFNKINMSFGENKTNLNENEILLENKSLNGLDIKSSHKNFDFRLLGGRINTDKIEEEINGNGTQGPYFLKIKPIYPYSEEVKTNNTRLLRDLDYIIDYDLGILKFTNKYIKNSEKILLIYEAQNNINKNILAFESNFKPNSHFNIGFDYLKQFRPSLNDERNSSIINYNTYGVRFNYNKNENLLLNSYIAFQKSSETSKSSSHAGKINFLFKNNNFFLNLNYKKSGIGFKSLGNMEIYPNSNLYKINLSLKNSLLECHNELEDKNILDPSNISFKRHADSKLNVTAKHYFNLNYNFTHDQELYKNKAAKNISKVNHSVLLSSNKPYVGWDISFSSSKIYKPEKIEYLNSAKSSITLSTKLSLLNMFFENIKNSHTAKTSEYGLSLELKPHKNFSFKTNYNKYSYNKYDDSSCLQLNYNLNYPYFIYSSGNLNIKTISDNLQKESVKNKELSGIIKLIISPSQKFSLDYTYLPQVTKDPQNSIIKDFSIRQLNLLMSPYNFFSMELRTQKNNYFSKLNYNLQSNNYINDSYYLRSQIKLNNSLSFDSQLSWDIKTNNNHILYKRNNCSINTLLQFNQNNLLNLGYESEHDNSLIKKGIATSFSHTNNSKKFKYIAFLKMFSSNDQNNKSTVIEPSFEVSLNPNPAIGFNASYNYAKTLSSNSSAKNNFEASFNYHINKFFDFKFSASFYKNTQSNTKNTNIESIFTTSFQ